MNNISDFTQCSNCGACYNACPVGAISVREDGLFYHVAVDEAKCISCGLCKKVCPVNTPQQVQKPLAAYAAIHRDAHVVKVSSSGGVFTAIAERVLKQGGVVFGAAYSNDCRSVEMASTENKTLEELRRSKYVESKVGMSFQEVKHHLVKQNRYVLYCGSPCQIAGLKRYLRKDYEKLITCDFSCGGMPSHRLYAEYLDNIEKKLGAAVCEVNFRPKIYGWSTHAMQIKATNGRKYKKVYTADPYFDCFIGGHMKYSVREYCLSCQFADNHYADIILADLWKLQLWKNADNSNQGVSLIIANSPKGEEMIRNLSESVSLIPLELGAASYNLAKKHYSDELISNRARFLKKCEQVGFMEAVKEHQLKSSSRFLLKYYIKKLIGRS